MCVWCVKYIQCLRVAEHSVFQLKTALLALITGTPTALPTLSQYKAKIVSL